MRKTIELSPGKEKQEKNVMKMDAATLSFTELKSFIERNYLKNRVAVSSDIAVIFDDIEKTTGLSVIKHYFSSGEDYGTWIVPPRWDVKEAWIKGADGKMIASYDDHPLFVCGYSKAVHTKLSKDELLPHITFEPKQPDAYAYNWRYIMDAKLRLKDWGISLPKTVVDSLDEGPYEVCIDVEVQDDKMIVGEINLPGESEEEILFLANYCHSGQVNDSFSGLAMFMGVMHELAKKKKRHYTYRLLMMQETIGSAVFITKNHKQLKEKVKGAIFSEMVGYGKNWYIKHSREGNTYMDSLGLECCKMFEGVNMSPFFGVYGNDELMFNSVQCGIPSLSVQKYPFDEYHTSNDNPSKLVERDMNQARDMILHMVEVLEKDAVYEFTGPVPFWMTRFQIYSDNINEKEEFSFKRDIIYQYLDGQRTVLEIAILLNTPFDRVYSFIKKMAEEGLVRKKI